MNDSEWIVLPRVADRTAWIERLRQAAAEAGRVLHDWDEGEAVDLASRPILLTVSAEIARAHQADEDRIAAIVAAADIAAFSGLGDPERHASAAALSDTFAQAAALPAARVFGPSRFGRAAVELLPGLFASPPAPSAPSLDDPFSEALRVYLEGQARWSRKVLTWAGAPLHGPEQSSLDVTGRPRFLIHGPYIVMPPGRWKAAFTLSFDKDASRYLYRADWGGVEHYASQEFRPGRAGIFRLEMVHDWAVRGACEFRLLVQEGVFHGSLTLSDLEISRAD